MRIPTPPPWALGIDPKPGPADGPELRLRDAFVEAWLAATLEERNEYLDAHPVGDGPPGKFWKSY
jgi:hypothetical protein